MCFWAAALFSISDPFNTTFGVCFFYHLLHVCRLYVPLHVTWPLLTSAPRSPHFLFEVSWTGWRTWLRASQVAGLGPGKANEPICTYLHISQVEVIEGAIWFQPAVTLFFPPEDHAFRWKKVFATDKWNNGSGPICLSEPGFDLNPGAGWCPTVDRETSVCTEPGSLRRPACV